MKRFLIAIVLITAGMNTYSQPDLKRIDSSSATIPQGLCDLSDSITIKYVRSLLSGALVGIGTGMVTAFSDTLAPNWWPITWFLAMNARCDLVTSIGNDMTGHNIAYHDGLMRLSALVATWIAWYKTYYHLNGAPPFAQS